jgi:hypothetical protein
LGNFLIEGYILNQGLAPFLPTTDGDGKKQMKKKVISLPLTGTEKSKRKKKVISFPSYLLGGREGKPKKTHTHTHTNTIPSH